MNSGLFKMLPTNYSFSDYMVKISLSIERETDRQRQDLALNNLNGLIYHKTQLTKFVSSNDNWKVIHTSWADQDILPALTVLAFNVWSYHSYQIQFCQTASQPLSVIRQEKWVRGHNIQPLLSCHQHPSHVERQGWFYVMPEPSTSM